MYPIYVFLSICALCLFVDKYPEFERLREAKERLREVNENISFAKDYIQIARELKSKGEKEGATLGYQYAIKLLRSSQGTLARKLLEQTLEEVNVMMSDKN